MKKNAGVGARYLLGVILTIFGLNGFFNFLPPMPMSAEAGQFMGALAGTGYFLPFIKTVEVVCGILLLSGRFVPLVATILAPHVIHILLFHMFLAPSGLPVGVLLVALDLIVALSYWKSYEGVLQPNAKMIWK